MASLKALRGRINSVRSTRKITSAMKMVAASKLRRAQSRAEAARPYAVRMQRMLAALAANVQGSQTAPRMLVGSGADRVHLLIPITADRGLAGAFNTNVGRATRNLAHRLLSEGKTVKILAVGRKSRDYLRRDFTEYMIGDINYIGRKGIGFTEAREIGERVTEMLLAGEFDVCTIIYNRFVSVMSQVTTEQQLIPAPPIEGEIAAESNQPQAQYEFEPDEETILARLLPQNLAIQIYRAQLESSAGFFASQMTAMDNATRNAGDMINRLTLNYNRTRQANITSELIEIISGAEAL